MDVRKVRIIRANFVKSLWNTCNSPEIAEKERFVLFIAVLFFNNKFYDFNMKPLLWIH